MLIERSLTETYGNVGGCLEIKIIKLEEKGNEGIVWCKRENATQVWASISMIFRYGVVPVRALVLQSSSYLSSLSSSSRNFFQPI